MMMQAGVGRVLPVRFGPLGAGMTETETSLTAVNDLAIRRALEVAGVEFIDENGGARSAASKARKGKIWEIIECGRMSTTVDIYTALPYMQSCTPSSKPRITSKTRRTRAYPETRWRPSFRSSRQTPRRAT